MKQEIIIAGFGGQGVLSMGKILAYSGLMENKEVTWMPAYGPEQRGGTANVTVIVSDERISSPILSQYDTAIILNQPSLAKFENKVKPGGILIYDGYGIIEPPTRKDIQIYRIDAMDAANERGIAKTFNNSKRIIKGRTFHSGKALPFIFILYLCGRYEKNILTHSINVSVQPSDVAGTKHTE